MRLCFVANPSSVHVRRWLGWFVDRGHDVSLIAVGGEEPIPGVARLAHRRYPSTRGTVRLPEVTLWMRRHVAAARPDLVHAHWLPWSGWCTALTRRTPLVLTPWGSDMLVLGARRREVRALNRMALRRADLVTWDSTALRDACLLEGVAAARLERIHFGVDLARFTGVARDAALRHGLGLGEGEVVVLSPRIPGYRSHVDVIIRAFASVVAEQPAVRLLVRHDGGNEESSLRGLATELGVGRKVSFVGRLPEVQLPDLYALSDVTVSVPPSDSAPVSIAEAMASGSAPIVSALPWVREWLDETGAEIVAPGDVRQLTAALRGLVADPSRREAMLRRNRRVVARLADRDREMGRMERLYQRLCSHEPAAQAT